MYVIQSCSPDHLGAKFYNPDQYEGRSYFPDQYEGRSYLSEQIEGRSSCSTSAIRKTYNQWNKENIKICQAFAYNTHYPT